MGLFDNFIKQIDNGLKAVESGAIEKRLDDIAGAIDRAGKQADGTLAKVATKPAEVLDKLDAQKEAVEQKAGTLKQQAGVHMDIIRGKS